MGIKTDWKSEVNKMEETRDKILKFFPLKVSKENW